MPYLVLLSQPKSFDKNPRTPAPTYKMHKTVREFAYRNFDQDFALVILYQYAPALCEKATMCVIYAELLRTHMLG